MVKVNYSGTKGLVQSAGGFSFTWDGAAGDGTLKVERKAASDTVDTVNGTTETDTAITIPAGAKVVGFKVEVLSSVGTPAGNITDLGFKSGDVDALMNQNLSASAVGTVVGFPAVAPGGALADGNVLQLAHTDPGGASKTSKVRVTVMYEEAS
jgi:hypothetical protein